MRSRRRLAERDFLFKTLYAKFREVLQVQSTVSEEGNFFAWVQQYSKYNFEVALMPRTDMQKVYALLPFNPFNSGNFEIDPTWVSCDLHVVTLDAVDGQGVPRRRINDVYVAFGSMVILDSNGYFIKRPPVELIGESVVRLFSNNMDWLQQRMKPINIDALRLAFRVRAMRGEDVKLTETQLRNLRASPAYDHPAYMEFVQRILPKGTHGTML